MGETQRKTGGTRCPARETLGASSGAHRAARGFIYFGVPTYSLVCVLRRGSIENGELIVSNVHAVLWCGACGARVLDVSAEAGIPSIAQMRTLHSLSYNTIQGLPGQQVRAFTYCAQAVGRRWKGLWSLYSSPCFAGIAQDYVTREQISHPTLNTTTLYYTYT